MSRDRQNRISRWAAALMVALAWANVHAAEVAGVRLWPAPDHTRVVLDLDGPAKHKVFTLENPNRVVIDIRDARLKTRLSGVALEASPVSKIRSGVRNGKDLRLVLDLQQKLKPRAFLLPPNPPYGNRLVIDLYGETRKKPAVAKRDAKEKREQRRDVLIALDAGHGGEDPGAIGAGGVREKDVVLSITRKLESMLKKERGFKPVLVRDGDYYIGLRKRTEIARAKRADLFVSIHADAFKDSGVRGSAVYTLSHGGATSETARWLAERENRSDLIGGVGGVSLTDKERVLASVLLDLSMTGSMSASQTVGRQVLSQLGSVNRLHKHDIEGAGFAVLKSPDVPSILVETGFISNPQEARRLGNPDYQDKMARALLAGIKAYFRDQPPEGSLLAALRQQDSPQRHVIRYGDTLSEIASHYGISTGLLRKVNGLRGDRIRVGQVLNIPAS